MPGWFHRVTAGVIGGVAGGIVFGVMMQMTGTIPMVASLVDRESIAVGWAVHLSIAIFVGTTYALIFGLLSTAPSVSTILGVFYGVVWWVLGGLTLMPLRLGMGLFVFNTTAWQSLAGHAAYGLALGVVYALVAQWGIAAEWPRAGEEAAVAGPDEPVPYPEAYPGPPQFAPRPPGTRVTPLWPEARDLRQRHGHWPGGGPG